MMEARTKKPFETKKIRPSGVSLQKIISVQLKKSLNLKHFLASFRNFFQFAHILWQTTRPAIVLPVFKTVSHFYRMIAIPTSLWNAYDYVLQFNFSLALLAGPINTATDFLSRLVFNVTQKIRSRIQGTYRSKQ